jgi:hypothetical protein
VFCFLRVVGSLHDLSQRKSGYAVCNHSVATKTGAIRYFWSSANEPRFTVSDHDERARKRYDATKPPVFCLAFFHPCVSSIKLLDAACIDKVVDLVMSVSLTEVAFGFLQCGGGKLPLQVDSRQCMVSNIYIYIHIYVYEMQSATCRPVWWHRRLHYDSDVRTTRGTTSIQLELPSCGQ